MHFEGNMKKNKITNKALLTANQKGSQVPRVLTAVLLTVMTLGVISCKKKAPAPDAAPVTSDVLLVGEVGSMTGGQATFGISTHNGIDLAIKKINVAGVKGKKFQLISMDDQGKPEEAATAVTKLITQNKVIAILGEVASSISLAMGPIAQNYKIPMISPSSTNPKVTEIGDYIFRVCFIDPFQGTVMAKFASENLKFKKVALLTDIKNDYSVGLSKYFAETFKKMGGEIVAEQSYSAGDIDFKAQLTSLRGKNPQAIFVPGYYTEVGLIARQAKELGLKVPLMGGDGWDSPKLKEIGQKAIEGSYFSNHYSEESKEPHVQAFIAEFKQAYGVVPDGLAALGYDSMMILADAVNRAADFTPAAIKDQIATTKDFQGVTGKITIDANRNVTKAAVVLKVIDTGFKYETTVNP